jgi:SAM-dependent methyltransferase
MKLFRTPEFFREFGVSMRGKRVLDLGCGPRKFAGALGVDLVAAEGVDLIHDLDQFPYPLERASFDGVVLNHVVEHLASLPRLMDEVHALLKPGGLCWIATPHFTDADSWADPTHKFHFSIRTMNAFGSQFKLRLAYVSLKGMWKDLGYERWVNVEGLHGHTGRRIERWEARKCFSRRGGEMFFILEKT